MTSKQQKKILIFESRYICYDSGDAFLHIIGEELKKQGVQVDFCKISNPEAEEEKLNQYIGKEYDAMLDLNSNLVFAYCDDQKDYYFNLIHAPFYNILVDHPIHLHERLNIPLKDYHVICIDSYHADYINHHYPHIKSALVIPFGGISAKNCKNHMSEEVFMESFSKRDWDILLPVTYVPDDYYLSMLKKKNLIHTKYAMDCYDLLASEESCTLENAVRQVYQIEEGIPKELGNDNLMEIRLIDRYIRARMRNHAVEEILKTGRNVHVLGANWNMYEGNHKKQLILHNSETYLESLNEFCHSKVIFNMQPLFLDGPHDRILNAMANGCVVLTDTCGFLRQKFEKGKHFVGYRRNQLEKLPNIIEDLFAQGDVVMAPIAWNGYKQSVNHTWGTRVVQFLQNT